jgi:hypothetical protein
MGYLKKFTRLFRSRAAIQQLPVGSLTVDRDGRIITSTVSSTYPTELLGEIGRGVLALFREARAAQLPLAEVSVHFGSLLVTARELRGGTIIFLQPQSALSQPPT